MEKLNDERRKEERKMQGKEEREREIERMEWDRKGNKVRYGRGKDRKGRVGM